MKIADIKINVIKREIPDTGLDSDLGRFAGTVEQGLLRILTDDGIEGNCYIGGFRGGGRSLFGQRFDGVKVVMGNRVFEPMELVLVQGSADIESFAVIVAAIRV